MRQVLWQPHPLPPFYAVQSTADSRSNLAATAPITRINNPASAYNPPPERNSMALDRESVLSALRTVKDPELFKDIVTLGMVKDVKVDGSHVHVHVELTTPACPL